jgi:CheY-like chemotaxis protein
MHEDKRALRILVVDDNSDAAETLAVLLEIMGHQATTAGDGLEAVQMATREPYDVVLLDLGMPIMDGFQAAVFLRQLEPAPLLIACSAWCDADSRRRTTELGFSAHLPKPARLQVLEAALEPAYCRLETGSGWRRVRDGETQGVAHPHELG